MSIKQTLLAPPLKNGDTIGFFSPSSPVTVTAPNRFNRAKSFLVNKGFDKVYGARPLRRAIQRYLEDPLSEEILKGTVKYYSVVDVNYTQGDEGFTFKSVSIETESEGESHPVVNESNVDNEKP